MKQTKDTGFAISNGVVLDQVTATTATAHIDLTRASLNLYGIVHGGLLFTLADTTAGIYAKSDNNVYVTLEANMNYLESISSGRITATATCIRRGNTTCVVDVNITSDKNLLLARGTFTMYRLNIQPK